MNFIDLKGFKGAIIELHVWKEHACVYLLNDLKDQFNNVLPVQKFIPMYLN